MNCEKCGNRANLSHHHIMPAFAFRGKGNVAILCLTCHKQIEAIYLRAEGKAKGGKRNVLPEDRYYELFGKFIKS